MKKLRMFAVVGVLALGLTGTSAQANSLDVDSNEYLGLINPANEASIANEATYINTLLAQSLGSGPTTIGGQAYTRSSNSCINCPIATAVGAFKLEADLSKGVPNPAFNPSSINVDGFTYLLAKYDGPNYGSAVWYVGDLSGNVAVPASLPSPTQYGISHYTLFKATSVPDGGMTLILLGGALVGLETLRRRFKA